MKAILSILFSFLFLLQALGTSMDLCCDLPKLPNLFEHYKEYADHDGLSFISFLDLHYGDGHTAVVHHHDDEHDKNLPFQRQHQCCHAQIFIAPALIQPEIATLYFSTQRKNSLYNFSLCSEYSDSPFQPPKA